jgi:sigma-E factor negative regulatory protein RseB
MRRLSLVCAAVLVSAPAAADDAAAWLLKVSDAARQANYQGVVVYRDGQRMDVMRLVHRQQQGRVQERLTSLTGKPRDILREGDRVAYYVGDEPVRSGEQQSLFPVLSQELLAQAATHYEFQDLGVARVAARPCRGVLMSPRDEFRYGYEICGDAVTAVPLRVTLLDRRGRTVEQLMFTEVAYPQHIADTAFTPPPGALAVGDRPTPATPEAAAGAAATWQLATLPPGFRVVRRSLAPSPDGQGLVEHVLLSDGLSVVSVYGTRPGAREQAFRGLSNMGAMSAYGRRVGAFHITVIGEVPVSTVRMIGDGMTAPDPAPGAAPEAAPDSVEPDAERHEPESLTD